MNILITGGTGFIGQLFIKQFATNTYTVVTRNISKANNIFGSMAGVTLIKSLDELTTLDEFDAVINLAGEPIVDKRWTAKQKQVIETSRWQTTQKIVSLFKASQQPPSVFLSGSAIGIYGDHGDKKITESTPVNAPDFSSELCKEWENIAAEVESTSRVVYLRTGIVLHPQFGALQRMILPFKLGLGGPIADGQHYFSWIHWQDMISAMNRLLSDESLSGAFNMTSPTAVTNRDFTKALGQALHRPTIMPMPAFVLETIMGESAELLLASQRVVPEALVEAGFEFQYTDVHTALVQLVDHERGTG